MGGSFDDYFFLLSSFALFLGFLSQKIITLSLVTLQTLNCIRLLICFLCVWFCMNLGTLICVHAIFFCKQIHWIEAKRGNKNSLFFFCSLCLMSLILLLLFLLLLFVCNDKHEFATTIFFITTHHKRIFGSQIVVFFLFFSPHWCGYFVLLFVYKPNISSIVLCKYRIHVENSPISTCKWKKTDDRSF